MTPTYQHDCDQCVPLGTYEGDDLYWCDQRGFPTVMARYGDDPEDYRSGLDAAKFVTSLAVAKQRAAKRGLAVRTEVAL